MHSHNALIKCSQFYKLDCNICYSRYNKLWGSFHYHICFLHYTNYFSRCILSSSRRTHICLESNIVIYKLVSKKYRLFFHMLHNSVLNLWWTNFSLNAKELYKNTTILFMTWMLLNKKPRVQIGNLERLGGVSVHFHLYPFSTLFPLSLLLAFSILSPLYLLSSFLPTHQPATFICSPVFSFIYYLSASFRFHLSICWGTKETYTISLPSILSWQQPFGID